MYTFALTLNASRGFLITAVQPVASVAIHEQLRSLIVRGRLLPGMRLTEVDVARQLNTSRTPAREALRQLRQEGLLVPAGPAGAGKMRLAVAPMTREEAHELYHAAGALEGITARNVTSLSRIERAALAARLGRAEAAFEREARRSSPDWDRLFDLHQTFHSAFTAVLAGPKLQALLSVLRPQLDRYEYLYAPLLGPGFEPTYEEHAAIVRAIRSGTADAAERAVRANWFRGAARLARVLESVGEAGFLRAPVLEVPGVRRLRPVT